jgi:hypothetical protein
MYRRDFMKTTAFFGAAVAGAAAIASSAEATSGVKLNELGSEGETLARRVGLWDLTETRWTKPGAEPATSRGLVAEVGGRQSVPNSQFLTKGR